MADMSPKAMAQALLDGGMVSTWDEAVHRLVNEGEISMDDHEQLLSWGEAERIYG